MGLKYTKRAMTSYEVHRFFHGLEFTKRFKPNCCIFHIFFGIITISNSENKLPLSLSLKINMNDRIFEKIKG